MSPIAVHMSLQRLEFTQNHMTVPAAPVIIQARVIICMCVVRCHRLHRANPAVSHSNEATRTYGFHTCVVNTVSSLHGNAARYARVAEILNMDRGTGMALGIMARWFACATSHGKVMIRVTNPPRPCATHIAICILSVRLRFCRLLVAGPDGVCMIIQVSIGGCSAQNVSYITVFSCSISRPFIVDCEMAVRRAVCLEP